ncbi:MAG: hypothetical protein PVG11_03530 [Anaerolineae bacterium]
MNDTSSYLNRQDHGTVPPARPGSDASLEDTPSNSDIPTPPALHRPAQGNVPPPPQSRGRSPLLASLVGLALIISLASLALNVLLIYTLRNAQQAAVQGIDQAIAAVDSFGGEGFQYEYQFSEEIPISTSVPVRQQMVIPFEGEFPINTNVQVPIDAGILGTFVIDVPIDTSVYVSTEVPVNIDETFEFNATIPISLTVPIDVGTDDPEIEGFLTGIRDWLADLRESLTIDVLPPLLSGTGEAKAPADP